MGFIWNKFTICNYANRTQRRPNGLTIVAFIIIISGAIVKNMGNEPIKKYKRKECPVCKGSGQYLSGDGIKMVDCGYCIPDKK